MNRTSPSYTIESKPVYDNYPTTVTSPHEKRKLAAIMIVTFGRTSVVPVAVLHSLPIFPAIQAAWLEKRYLASNYGRRIIRSTNIYIYRKFKLWNCETWQLCAKNLWELWILHFGHFANLGSLSLNIPKLWGIGDFGALEF